jgi:hypothetical protein
MATRNASLDVDKLSTSFQNINLKQNTNRYLSLPDDPFTRSLLGKVNYTVYLPPMNSSGDIYHIISYLMLSKYEGKQLPLVQLSYDGISELRSLESKMNTFTQTIRCLQFAKSLGFQKQFIWPIDFGDGGYRQNARSSKMLDHLKGQHDQKKNICYIEQKLLTTLISYYFLEYGRDHAVEILNKSYAKWSVNKNVNEEIRKDVQEAIQIIQDKSRPKPLIILQYRYSSHANQHQNIQDDIYMKLGEYLESKNYAIWYLFVDSRSREPQAFSSIENKTYCFPYTINDVDYGKLYHLELLLQLSKIKNVRGIIGNTSGCLDLAAFIGYNVLNLHNFQNEISYQSYRIFLQSSFLIIEDFNEDVIKNALRDEKKRLTGFTDKITEENMPITTAWINRKKNTPVFPGKLLQMVREANVQNNGFIDLHQIITWQNDELEETSIQFFDEFKNKLLEKMKNSSS